MSGSRLNRRLTLEALQQVPDGAGGYVESWAALGDLWADVDAGRGRTAGLGEVAGSTVTARILVRGAPVGALSRPAPAQRFRDGTRTWRILAVSEADPDGWFLACETIEERAV